MGELIKFDAKIRGIHRYSFRSGEWAKIIGVKICKSGLSEPRPVFQCIYDDGVVDYIPISDDFHYEIAEWVDGV